MNWGTGTEVVHNAGSRTPWVLWDFPFEPLILPVSKHFRWICTFQWRWRELHHQYKTGGNSFVWSGFFRWELISMSFWYGKRIARKRLFDISQFQKRICLQKKSQPIVGAWGSWGPQGGKTHHQQDRCQIQQSLLNTFFLGIFDNIRPIMSLFQVKFLKLVAVFLQHNENNHQ